MPVTLTQLQEQVKRVKDVKKTLDHEIEIRNDLLYRFVKENKNKSISGDMALAYELAFEVRLTPATIYNALNLMKQKEEAAGKEAK